MIVRIHQLPIRDIDTATGWPDEGLNGSIRYDWPGRFFGYELVVREENESSEPVPDAQRQQQLRRLLPRIVEALRVEGHEIVIRLDGPMRRGELLEAFNYLTDEQGKSLGRFAISAVQQFDSGNSLGSIRLVMDPSVFAAMCADENVGLGRELRLRLFSVPTDLVNPLLDTEETDDERWPVILPETGFVVETGKELKSIYVRTSRYGPEEITERLMRGMGEAV
jgi:hypothetical protein